VLSLAELGVGWVIITRFTLNASSPFFDARDALSAWICIALSSVCASRSWRSPQPCSSTESTLRLRCLSSRSSKRPPLIASEASSQTSWRTASEIDPRAFFGRRFQSRSPKNGRTTAR